VYISAHIICSKTHFNHIKRFLESYIIDTKSGLTTIFGSAHQKMIDKTEFVINFGQANHTTYFAFLKGSTNSFSVHGISTKDILEHLIHDYSFLEKELNRANINTRIDFVNINIDDVILRKKKFRDYVSSKTSISELIAFIGVSNISTALQGVIDETLLINSLIGIVIWFIVTIIGFYESDEYGIRQ
jgi:hypothetical protein